MSSLGGPISVGGAATPMSYKAPLAAESRARDRRRFAAWPNSRSSRHRTMASPAATRRGVCQPRRARLGETCRPIQNTAAKISFHSGPRLWRTDLKSHDELERSQVGAALEGVVGLRVPLRLCRGRRFPHDPAGCSARRKFRGLQDSGLRPRFTA
jgi:hypothetical protein